MEVIKQIAECVEFGKINKATPYPPSMKDQDGADELVLMALDRGITAEEVLSKGLVEGMRKIGVKFRDNKVFVPEVLMAARAMTAGMAHLKPHFSSGSVKHKGTFLIGTVQGDLHDIGKKIVAMMIEGAGWELVDLGANVSTDKFLESIEKHKGCYVGISALLTTTMVNMEGTVSSIKRRFPDTKVLIGGAPVTEEFKNQIGADFYSSDPQDAVEYINGLGGSE